MSTTDDRPFLQVEIKVFPKVLKTAKLSKMFKRLENVRDVTVHPTPWCLVSR